MKIGSIVSALALVVAAGAANAAIISQWTVTTAFPTGAGLVPTGTFYSIGAADIGAITAGTQLSSTHSVAAATYTSPAGNGSQFGFSSNNWAAGDYYEARVITTGYDTISITWDQARSSTGPSLFDLVVSYDGGTNFTTLSNDYVVLQSGGGGSPGTWSSVTFNPIYRTSNVAAGAGADNNGLVIFRFVAQTAGSAATGTGRIDNVTIEGNLIPSPGAMALMGLGGLVAARRRRA
jgi:hypothetical protein